MKTCRPSVLFIFPYFLLSGGPLRAIAPVLLTQVRTAVPLPHFAFSVYAHKTRIILCRWPFSPAGPTAATGAELASGEEDRGKRRPGRNGGGLDNALANT
jgi:hypothetical protein